MKKPLIIGIVAILLIGLGYLIYTQVEKAKAAAAKAPAPGKSGASISVKTPGANFYVNADGTVNFSRDAAGNSIPV